MDIFKDFAADTTKEIEGAWAPLGDGKILVARLGNRKYTRMLTKEIEEASAILALKDDAADAKSDEIMARVLSETILLGWEAPVSYKGRPYSKETALLALSHADFRKRVMDEAAKFEHFKAAAEEEQGNVSPGA